MNIQKYCVLTAILLTMGACDKFLDRPPLDTITDQELSFSRTEMELYSNKYYGSFQTFNGYDLGIFELDNASDNMVSGDYNYNARLAGTVTVPSAGGGWDWTAIRGINFFLANYHITKEAPALVNPYIGEMYFWRAWYYFDMMKAFGDLPWYNQPLGTESEELYAERISRSIIADSILADLDKAITLLPEKGQAVQGRLHRDVASLFQSRVALYEGTWEKYHAGTPFGVQGGQPDRYFRKAVAALEGMIQSQTYQIGHAGASEEDYRQLFNQTDLANNPEVLLWRKYDRALDVYHFAQNYFGVSDKNTGLSKSLVESYLCTDGLPISLSLKYQGDHTIKDVVANRDPRLAQTMYTSGKPRVVISGDTVSKFTVPDMTLESRLRNTTGYQLYKGVDPAADHTAGDITASIIFRYAEALLNYAEAKAELGECDQTVLDQTVNQLRNRVEMPALTATVGFVDPNWDFPELSGLLNEIRRERRVELACEGYRFDDLMRWAATHLIQRPMLGAKMQQYEAIKNQFNPILDPSAIPTNNQGYIAPHWNSPARDGWQFDPEAHYLSPLPQRELTLNPALRQNPGYLQ